MWCICEKKKICLVVTRRSGRKRKEINCFLFTIVYFTGRVVVPVAQAGALLQRSTFTDGPFSLQLLGMYSHTALHCIVKWTRLSLNLEWSAVNIKGVQVKHSPLLVLLSWLHGAVVVCICRFCLSGFLSINPMKHWVRLNIHKLSEKIKHLSIFYYASYT